MNVPAPPPFNGEPQAPPTPPPIVPPPNTNPPAPPQANADSYNVAGGTLEIGAATGVLANDINPTGQSMTAQLVSQTAFGTVALTSTGSFVYTTTANPGVAFTDSFSYVAVAGGLWSNTATVTLHIAGPAAPTANDDSYAVDNGALAIPASGVLANDTNPGTLPMTATMVAFASNGNVVLHSDGSFTYAANAGFTGTDTFSYTATAGGQVSNVATVTLTVTGVAPPTAVDDAYTVNGSTLSVAASGVLGNDFDPNGDPMTAVLVTPVGHGTAFLNSDGSFTYTAYAGYVGADSFTYQVTAGGLMSNVATVTLTVIPRTPPTAVDDAYTVKGGIAVAAPGVMGNDTNPGSQSMTATLVSVASHGTETFNPDGSFTYTAYAGYVGTDVFTYAVTTDGMTSNVATVTLTVIAPVPPTAVDDTYALPPNGGVLTVSAGDGLQGNDISPAGLPLTSVLDVSPAHGSVTLNGDGSFTYVPNAGTISTDSFTYHVTDGMAASSSATVTLTFGTGTVEGFIWLDANADGDQSAGEAGVPAVTVYLFDVANSPVATTTSDSTGHYHFTGVASDASYHVQIAVPEGYDTTAEHVGDPSLDSDVDAYGATDVFYVGAGTDTTCDAGVKPAAAKPTIYFVAAPDTGRGYVTSTLRVAKWENAFEKNAGKITVKPNFTTLDPDHFYIQVKDVAATANTITVHVKTSIDTGNDIILEKVAGTTGVYNSKGWLLLTSVTVDDAYRVGSVNGMGGIEDNTLGDPTFLVRLGDTVTASYTGGAAPVEATAKVPVEKIVKLHLIVLRKTAGDRATTTAGILNLSLRAANAIYAPVGIKFTNGQPSVVNPPPGVDLSDGLTEHDLAPPLKKGETMKMSDAEQALLGDEKVILRTAAPDDIEVYFVNFLALKSDRQYGSQGEAFWAAAVPDQKYADSIIMAGAAPYLVLAHEIGHILMNNGEHLDATVGVNRVNLMSYPPLDPLRFDVFDPRRINAAQAKAMMENRKSLLTAP